MRMNGKKLSKLSKPAYEQAVPINITLPPSLHQRLPEVVRKFGFKGPADYFQSRLRKDAGLDLAA